MISKLRDAINSLPVIRTLHKIYLVHSTCEKIARDLQALDYKQSLAKTERYDISAMNSPVSGVVDQPRMQPLLVSLTTYGERIHSVHIAIESLLQQVLKADLVVLWLAEDEFSYDMIPEVLKLQEKRGLKIKFTRDIKSYKKLVPALKSYPGALIVTVDDDFIYPVNFLDRLYKAWLKEPEIIHCYRAHRMKYDDAGTLLPYNNWDFEVFDSDASMDIFPTGGAGALYFPGCFYSDVGCEDKFMSLCPTADDVWFKVMSLLKHIPCKVLPEAPDYARIEAIPVKNTACLWDVNKLDNDVQLSQLISLYQPQLGNVSA